jgi:hypothetical protein
MGPFFYQPDTHYALVAEGALPDHIALVRGEAGLHRQHEAAGRDAGVELLGHGANPNARFFRLGHGVQDQPGLASEPVELADEELIELQHLNPREISPRPA